MLRCSAPYSPRFRGEGALPPGPGCFGIRSMGNRSRFASVLSDRLAQYGFSLQFFRLNIFNSIFSPISFRPGIFHPKFFAWNISLQIFSLNFFESHDFKFVELNMNQKSISLGSPAPSHVTQSCLALQGPRLVSRWGRSVCQAAPSDNPDGGT